MKTPESDLALEGAPQHGGAPDTKSDSLTANLDEFLRYLADALVEEYLERLRSGTTTDLPQQQTQEDRK